MALRVLGIGSPFGDDQLGWEVIKLLQASQPLHHYIPHKLELSHCDRPGLYLLELMRDARCVFLIDAIKTGSKIGTIHCFKNETIEGVGSALSTHSIGMAEAMQMGRALQTLPKTVLLYGLEIGDVRSEWTMTAPIIEAIKALSMRLEQDILSLLSTH